MGLWEHLSQTVLPRYVANTIVLMVGVTVFTLMFGLSAAWTVVRFDFPGPRIFEWLLLLHAAVPAQQKEARWTRNERRGRGRKRLGAAREERARGVRTHALHVERLALSLHVHAWHACMHACHACTCRERARRSTCSACVLTPRARSSRAAPSLFRPRPRRSLRVHRASFCWAGTAACSSKSHSKIRGPGKSKRTTVHAALSPNINVKTVTPTIKTIVLATYRGRTV